MSPAFLPRFAANSDVGHESRVVVAPDGGRRGLCAPSVLESTFDLTVTTICALDTYEYKVSGNHFRSV